jgi:hypothetical protein
MDNIIVIIIFIAISVAVFLITREFWCWYWKINQKLRTLESIDRRLEDLQRQNMNQSGSNGYPPIESGSANHQSKDESRGDNPYRGE